MLLLTTVNTVTIGQIVYECLTKVADIECVMFHTLCAHLIFSHVMSKFETESKYRNT